ncbi:UNVERIFIED_CONTAM: hypothetical protein FKN15_005647 [Acipenser sinensis]
MLGARTSTLRCSVHAPQRFDARRIDASTLSARTSTLDASVLDARRIDASTLGARTSTLDAWCIDASTLGARTSMLSASTLRRSMLWHSMFGVRHLSVWCTLLTLVASTLRRSTQPIDIRALFARGRGKWLGATPPPRGDLTRSLSRRRLQQLRPSNCRYPRAPPSLQLARDPQTIDVLGNARVALLSDPEAPPLAGNTLTGHGLAPCHPAIGDAPVPLVGTGVIGTSQAWQSSRQRCPSLWM